MTNQFKAKYLESMSITIPNDVGKASSSLPSHAVGFLSRKGSEFDAFVVADLEAERAALKKKAKDAKGKGKRTKEEADDEDGPAEDTNHGGHEIRSLVPLLPKHSHANKLFVGKYTNDHSTSHTAASNLTMRILSRPGWLTPFHWIRHSPAPRPISLALNLTLRPPPSVLPNASALSSLIASQPDPVPGSILSAADLLDPVAIQAKKRVRTQPPGLRMRLQLPGTRADVANVPSGAAQPAAKAPVAVDAMEVDEPVAVAPPVVGAKEKRSKEEKAERKAKKEAKKAKKESD